MTQGEAIEAFLNALDDMVRGYIYEQDGHYSYHSEIADAKMRITGALCVLLSGGAS